MTSIQTSTEDDTWEWEQQAEVGRLAKKYGHIEVVVDETRKRGSQFGIRRLGPVTSSPAATQKPVNDAAREKKMEELGIEYRIGDPAFEEMWEKFLMIHHGDVDAAITSVENNGFNNKRAYVHATVKAFERRNGTIEVG